MVLVVGAAAEAGVVEGVLVPGADDGAAGREGGERPRGEDAPGVGAVDRRRVGARGGGGGAGGSGRRGAVAFDVELEEVEEGAWDEGAEHQAATALHHPLQRHHDAHPPVRARSRTALVA